MKIVAQVDGVVYPSLHGHASFVEFPAVLPPSAVRAAACGGATTGLPTDPSLIGIFVGQVPFSLPPGYLAWFVNELLGAECVQEALMARNQSCGRVVLPVDRAQTVLLLSETALFDSTGVWIARNQEQIRYLANFCASLSQGHFGSQILRHALPKKCAVLRLQQRPRQPSRVVDAAILSPRIPTLPFGVPLPPHHFVGRPMPLPFSGVQHQPPPTEVVMLSTPMEQSVYPAPPYLHHHHHHHHHHVSPYGPTQHHYTVHQEHQHFYHHHHHHHQHVYRPADQYAAPTSTVFGQPPTTIVDPQAPLRSVSLSNAPVSYVGDFGSAPLFANGGSVSVFVPPQQQRPSSLHSSTNATEYHHE